MRVGIIGTGVIGGGWAAHFLRMGYDVVAHDPGPGAEERLRALVDNAWPVLTRLGLAAGASRDRLRFVGSVAEVGAVADFIQESTPEDLDTKIRLLAEIDAVTPPHVVVGSSTSGFAMTDMQVACAHPERFVVGHPFNPPYLIPLVEIVGGKQTAQATVEWAEDFYTRAGKVALVMETELPGFIGNRLQEALWREALHMVAAGEASVRQLDDSITYGPGLRWALMGPCLTFHLAGGPGGMGHMLDHFGPALLEPWTRLEAPPLTRELRDRMVEGCVSEADGRSVEELARERDDFLADLLTLLDQHRRKPEPAGRDLTQAPFAGYRTEVRGEWIDYNGHMNDSAYAVAMGEATEAFFDALGVGKDPDTGTTYTASQHLRYLAEVRRGDVLTARTLLVEADPKRLRVHHTLVNGQGVAVATGEHLYLHVVSGKVTPMPSQTWERVCGLLAVHAGCGTPEGLGDGVTMRR